MSGYRNIANMIFRKYRIVRSIIWSIEYIDFIKFRNNITQLIGIIHFLISILYGSKPILAQLNDYYAKMCIDEMHKRLMLEMGNFS